MIVHKELPPVAQKNQYVAIDSEWLRMNKRVLHRPTTGVFASLSICMNGEDVYLVTDENKVPEALSRIDDGVWVIQEAKFDLTQLRRLASIYPRTKLIDTILMERILYNGYYAGFSLQDLARRYLKIYLDKTEREKFSSVDVMTPEMLEYSAKDAWVLWHIWQEQKKHVAQSDMKIWKEIDMPALWAVMDFQGFRIDTEKWKNLAILNKARQSNIDAQLPFNPRSWIQVVEYLKVRGFKGIKSSKEEVLEKFVAQYPDCEAAELAKQILESRMYGKRASTYGMNYFDGYVEDEGNGVYTIHADYNIIGASTGRMCVSADTILDTDLGSFEISLLDLTKDKKYRILSHTGKQQLITNKFYKGQELMYEIQDENGNHIKCTGNHRILTPRGWEFARNLEVGDLAITKNNQNLSSDFSRTCACSGRGIVCRIGDSQKDEQSTNTSSIPDLECANIRHIEEAVRNEICRSFDASEALSVFNGTPGKHPQQTVSPSDSDSERCTLTIDRIKDVYNRYSKTTPSIRIYNPNELPISPDSKVWIFTSKYSNDRFGILESPRWNSSWTNRIYKRLLHQSRTILSKSLRGILKIISSLVVYKGTSNLSQLLFGEKKNKKVSRLLEFQQERDGFGFSSIGKAYSTYSAIQLLQKTNLRLFLSSIQPYCGSSRECSLEIGSNKIRSEEEENNIRLEYKLLRDSSRGCSQESSTSDGFITSKITSIQTCGILDVWDIEVEEDHSYVAQGFVHHNSSSDPNQQNIPARETSEFRECFIPRPDNVLLIADYSAQEPRIFAYQSQDKRLIEIFRQGKDVYCETGKSVFEEEIKKGDDRRITMKSVFLGLDYGMSAEGLALKENISVDRARQLISKFFSEYPDAAAFIYKQKKKTKIVETVLGRKFHLNYYDFKCERNALNSPIQGTAADMMKLALSRMHKDWKSVFPGPFGCVGVIHDEVVFDVPKIYAPQAKEFIQSRMEQAGSEICPGIKFKADVSIASSWAEKG